MQQRPRLTARHTKRDREVYLRRRIVVFGGIPLVLALIIYGFVAVLSGSSPKDAPPTPRASRSGGNGAVKHSAIGARSFVYTDASRTTYDYTTGQVAKGRKIVVEVRYPTVVAVAPSGDTVGDAPITKRAAYPLILFAPGYRLQPSDYAPLLDGWVRSGYLVASVDFPDTTFPASDAPYAAHLPHGQPEADLYNEPGDLAFALGALESAASTKTQWLGGLIDSHKVLLAGHSDGGSAVAALVYDAPYAHAGLSVRGVAVLSGSEFAIANQKYAQPSSGAVPLLVVQSAADRCDAPSGAVQLYNAITSPKYFDELTSASHIGAVNGSDLGAFAVVQATTKTFFAQSLGSRAITDVQLAASGTATGVAALTSIPLLAAIPAPSGVTSCPFD
jgi:predicted esterase